MFGGWVTALVAGGDLEAAEKSARRLFPSSQVEVVPGTRVPHVVVRVPLRDVGDWEATRLALGRLAPEPRGLVLTIPPRAGTDDAELRRTKAQSLLPVAMKLPSPRRVLDVDELLVYDVLVAAKSPSRLALVRDILGPVLREPGDTGRRLLATLDALHWHEGSAKAAARSLGVHVKTVHNRLRRLEELTGLSLDRPPDRMRLEVALYLLRAAEVGR